MEYTIIRDENYLEHHGVKGQKWGVRRYQNEDGTLTEEGKKHYGGNFTTNAIKRTTSDIDENFSRDLEKGRLGKAVRDVAGLGAIAEINEGIGDVAGGISNRLKISNGGHNTIATRALDAYSKNKYAQSDLQSYVNDGYIAAQRVIRSLAVFKTKYTTIGGRETTRGKEAVLTVLSAGIIPLARDISDLSKDAKVNREYYKNED